MKATNITTMQISQFVITQEKWLTETFVQTSILVFGFNVKRLSPTKEQTLEEFRQHVIDRAVEINTEITQTIITAGWVRARGTTS